MNGVRSLLLLDFFCIVLLKNNKTKYKKESHQELKKPWQGRVERGKEIVTTKTCHIGKKNLREMIKLLRKC